MKFLSKNLGVVAAAAMIMGWSSISSQAHIANVTVAPGGTLTFSPSVTNINVGDQVTWTWAATLGHTSTSGNPCTANGLWSSGGLSSGQTFTFTFNSAGNFPYFCSPHCSFGMTGEVIVASSVTVPTVQITSPTNGTVYAAPANVTIQATASDTGGTITSVQFRVGSTVLTNETTGPFAATTDLPAGSYALSAIATDSGGVKATNTVNISVVSPSPLVVNAAARGGAANFHFTYSTDSGLSYVVQRSTNLQSANWQPLATNTASGSSVNFTDMNATANPGFYRVGRLPNP